MLSFTEDSGADAEDSLEIFLFHECEAFGGEDEPGMNKTVDVGGLLIDGEISGMIENNTFNLRVLNLLGVLV